MTGAILMISGRVPTRMAIFIYSPFSSVVHEWLKHGDLVLMSHKLAATSWILFEVCGPAYRTNLRITLRNRQWCKPDRIPDPASPGR
jgi:hypothetical protein